MMKYLDQLHQDQEAIFLLSYFPRARTFIFLDRSRYTFDQLPVKVIDDEKAMKKIICENNP